MLKKFLGRIFMCLMICIFLSSCGSQEKSKEVSSKSDNGKYNAYINLNNYLTGWLSLNMQSYFNDFGFEEEITIKEKFRKKEFEGAAVTPIVEGAFKDVEKALEYTTKEPSYGLADDSMKELCPKVKEVLNTINEIDNYYSSKSFLEDDFAKGKELHKKIYNEYSECVILTEKFFYDFDLIAEEKKKESLEALKKKDMMIRYYAMDIVTKAQDIDNAFYNAEISDDNILDYDVSKYKEYYDPLIEGIDKFREYVKDDERLKKEGLNNTPFLDKFKFDLKYMEGSANNIMEILTTKDTSGKSNAKGSVRPNEKSITIRDFSTKVSSLVDSYNNLIR
ncbi:YiiG family protein [Clostridium sp. MSJ-4]|uniref:YiiG family protein n=1 Tax=Clostridium simiarum TaxID=2841506 RepID=A0ABS6F197_9CLOT|nr:YiiG family protein [Clostridium simiarum]